jgi:hypothetical protein
MKWNGLEILSNGDILDVICTISSQEEADRFMLLVKEISAQPEILIFRIASYINNADEIKRVLGLLLKRDFGSTFFVTQAPADKFGNTALKDCVMEVRITQLDGKPRFEILGPTEIASTWHTLMTFSYPYMVVDGPARMLTQHEWDDLVGFKRGV